MKLGTGYLTKTRIKLKSSTLVLFAFATAYFSRVLESIGFPSAINFVHFAFVPLICALVVTKVQTRVQASICKGLFFALSLFFGIILFSAIINEAGVINAILDFMLLAEPFVMIIGLISLPIGYKEVKQTKFWITCFAAVNLLFAYFQKFVIYRGLSGAKGVDSIKGVFLDQGAGHVVGASVSMTFALYYFVTYKNQSIWIRSAVVFAAFVHVIISDAKQVLAVFLGAWILLIMVRLKDVATAIRYLAIAALIMATLFWSVNTFEVLREYTTWARPEIYGPDGEATKLKFSAFFIIPTYYHSPLNWFLGLGPGHTVGRLGGWMIRDYWTLLSPLGVTFSPASDAVWAATGSSWLGDQSSMFSPLFGWAGIWGDLGFIGILGYLFLWFIVWRRVCLDDLSKFFVLTIFLFATIISQLEEPGYMLFVTFLIGLRWQEQQVENLKLWKPFCSTQKIVVN